MAFSLEEEDVETNSCYSAVSGWCSHCMHKCSEGRMLLNTPCLPTPAYTVDLPLVTNNDFAIMLLNPDSLEARN